VGQYAELEDGTPVTVESGLCGCAPGAAHTAPEKTTCIHDSGCVIDHYNTTENEVYAYDPAYYAWPTTEFPWLTELVASGEFVFYGWNPTAQVSDIVAFDATRTGAPGSDPTVHYWKSTAELHQNLVDMFWTAGDCDSLGDIDFWDQVIIEGAFFTWPGHPSGDWDGRADVVTDEFIDVKDVARLNRNFGKERES
jgi:hypothetical protein